MWGADSSNKKAGEKTWQPKTRRRAVVAATTRQMSTYQDETIIASSLTAQHWPQALL